jgi:hypothetical protein
VKPSTKIPPSYSSKTLSEIKEQLKRDTAVWRYNIFFVSFLFY